MEAKIQKWGNSLGLRIPKSIIKETKLNENSNVEVIHKNGNILIIPIKNKYSLDDLLANITESNLHNEVDDNPLGNEVW